MKSIPLVRLFSRAPESGVKRAVSGLERIEFADLAEDVIGEGLYPMSTSDVLS
jgi:hypothetical protein